QRLWQKMRAELPATAVYTASGTLWVAADAEEMEEVRRKHAFYGARGVRSEVLDPRELAEAEPNLRTGLAGALRVPGDAVIYPPCAAAWLLEGCTVRRTRVAGIGQGRVRLNDGNELA